jgi:hypothetical protein
LDRTLTCITMSRLCIPPPLSLFRLLHVSGVLNLTWHAGRRIEFCKMAETPKASSVMLIFYLVPLPPLRASPDSEPSFLRPSLP